MSPARSSGKKPRKKAALLCRPKRVISSQEHSYFKTALSQSRINNISYKKRNQKLLANNKTLAQALETSEINRQQQEEIILHLQRQLALSNPAVIKANIQKMGQLMQEVVQLMTNTLELADSTYDDFTVQAPLLLDTQEIPTVSRNSQAEGDSAPMRYSDIGSRRRSPQQDLREKFGLCDLSVINEDTVRLHEMTFAPILFTDGEEISCTRSSRRNSSRSKSSRRGRSAPSFSEGTPIAEANELSCGDNAKFGLSAKKSLEQNSPNRLSIKSRCEDDVLLQIADSRSSRENDVLSRTDFSQTPTTPVLTSRPTVHVLTPINQPQAEPVVTKSSIPVKIKDGVKKNTSDAEVSSSGLFKGALLRRGTFVISSTVSERDVNQKLPLLSSKMTDVTATTVSRRSPVSHFTNQDIFSTEKPGVEKVETMSSIMLQPREKIMLPHAKDSSDVFHSNAEKNYVSPSNENMTINLNEDMELTCSMGKILTAAACFPASSNEGTGKLINHSVGKENQAQVSNDEMSDATEIYCVQTCCNMLSPTSGLGTQLKGQTKINLENDVSDLPASQSKEFDVSKLTKSKSGDQKLVQNISVPKEHDMEDNSKSIFCHTAEPNISVETKGANTKTQQADMFADATKQKGKPGVKKTAVKAKENAALSLPPDFDQQTQPTNRRGTFVIMQKHEEHAPSNRKRKSRVKPGYVELESKQSKSPETCPKKENSFKFSSKKDSSCVSSKVEDTCSRSPKKTVSPHRSPRKTNDILNSSEKLKGMSQSSKNVSVFRKTKLSASQTMPNSFNKKESACKESTFKFFSNKGSTGVSKNALEKNANRSNNKPTEKHEEIVKQKDIYDVSLSVCAAADADDVKSDTAGALLSESEGTKCEHSGPEKDIQSPVIILHPKVGTWKRKNINKQNERSKKIRHEKQPCVEIVVEGLETGKAPQPNEIFIAPKITSLDEENVCHEAAHRSNRKRKTVSFKKPSVIESHLFSGTESAHVSFETSEDSFKGKNLNALNKEMENAGTHSDTFKKTRKTITKNKEFRESLVILEDIFSPIKSAAVSRTDKYADNAKSVIGAVGHKDITPVITDCAEPSPEEDSSRFAMSKNFASSVRAKNVVMVDDIQSTCKEPPEKTAKKSCDNDAKNSGLEPLKDASKKQAPKKVRKTQSKGVPDVNPKINFSPIVSDFTSNAGAKNDVAMDGIPSTSTEPERIGISAKNSCGNDAKNLGLEPLKHAGKKPAPKKGSRTQGKGVPDVDPKINFSPIVSDFTSNVGAKNDVAMDGIPSTSREPERTEISAKNSCGNDAKNLGLEPLKEAGKKQAPKKSRKTQAKGVPDVDPKINFNPIVSNFTSNVEEENDVAMDGIPRTSTEPERIGILAKNSCENDAKNLGLEPLKDPGKKPAPKKGSRTQGKGICDSDSNKILANPVLTSALANTNGIQFAFAGQPDNAETFTTDSCENNSEIKELHKASQQDVNRKQSARKFSKIQLKDADVTNESKKENIPNQQRSSHAGGKQEEEEENQQNTQNESSGRMRRKTCGTVPYKEPNLRVKLRREF